MTDFHMSNQKVSINSTPIFGDKFLSKTNLRNNCLLNKTKKRLNFNYRKNEKYYSIDKKYDSNNK